MKTTTAFDKIVRLRGLLRVVQGGTSASKTYSIIQMLHHIASNTKKKRLITIATDTTPNLKTGAIRDFQGILQKDGVWDDSNWNATDKIYTYLNAQIEFLAFDKVGKALGGRRDILFLNEANRLAYPIVDQLMVRTREYTIIDYNPTVEFWLHDNHLLGMETTEFLRLTYQDNEFLEENIVKKIEQKKPVYDTAGNLVSGDINWWRVYGEGELGVYEGLIYKQGQHWDQIEKIPTAARLVGYGLDFGYSQDPTAMVALFYCDGKYYEREMFYETELTNLYRDDMNDDEKQKTIQHKLETLGVSKSDLIVADSAEPKSIQDLQRLGYNCIGAKKGADSKRNGISLVQSQRPTIEMGSVNIITEKKRYQWKQDKDGRWLDEPEDKYDHCQDAERYIFSERVKPQKKSIDKKSRINQTFNRYAQYL